MMVVKLSVANCNIKPKRQITKITVLSEDILLKGPLTYTNPKFNNEKVFGRL